MMKMNVTEHSQSPLEIWREAWRFEINENNFQVRLRQVRARSNAHLSMNISKIALIFLLTLLLWEHLPHPLLLGWMCVVIVGHFNEIMQWKLKRGNAIQTLEQCREWDRRFRWLTLSGGLTWGLGAALVWYVPNDLAMQAILICTVFGLVAGAVTSNPVHPPSLIIYVTALIVPLMLRNLWEGDAPHFILFTMLILYFVYVSQAAFGLMRTYEGSLKQRFEKEALLAALRAREEELALALDSAEQANQAKSKFLATASHDLRQPLQALRLFTEALQDVAKEPQSLRLAGQINKSVKSLVEMFDDLLDVSRLDAGIIQPRWQNFLLNDLFDRLYVDFSPLARAKGLSLDLPNCLGEKGSVDGCDVVAYSDPFLLERMLRNLVSNAIRYTDQGKVAVRCSCSADQVEIAVFDTGIGIRPEVVEQIFEEYYQVDNPHRDRRKGLGLGLAIVRRVEELLGYRVQVESTPGKGSVFRFTLKKGQLSPVASPFEISYARQNIGGKVIAFVEDDADIREFTTEFMQEWGCQVFAGEDVGSVLRELDKAALRPHMLLCDYRLPKNQTALDVMRQMREHCGELPVLVVTGDTAAETLQAIQQSGASLLHKPIAPTRLRTAMFFAMQGSAAVL